jgi:hypothetical protein
MKSQISGMTEAEKEIYKQALSNIVVKPTNILDEKIEDFDKRVYAEYQRLKQEQGNK